MSPMVSRPLPKSMRAKHSRRKLEIKAAAEARRRRAESARKAGAAGALALAVTIVGIPVLCSTVFAPEPEKPRTERKIVPPAGSKEKDEESRPAAAARPARGAGVRVFEAPGGKVGSTRDIPRLVKSMADRNSAVESRRKLVAIIKANPGSDSYDAVLKALPGASQDVRRHLVKAACRARPAWSAKLLGEMLLDRRSGDALHAAILREIRRARVYSLRAVPDLDRYLESRDPAVRREAVCIVGCFGLDEHARKVITLLRDENESVRAAALAALRSLTGSDQEKEAGAWDRWFQREEAWFGNGGQTCFDCLDSGSVVEQVQAARKLSFRKLYRKSIAASLAPLLLAEKAALRRTACAALAQLGSFHAAPGLVTALSDEDREVRATACAGLRKMSGLDLPERPELWRRWLGRD